MFSSVIHKLIVNYIDVFADNPLHKKTSIYTMAVVISTIPPPTDFDRTRRRRRRPRCAEGACALGWVTATPQAERFAIAAGDHGAWNWLSESCNKHQKIGEESLVEVQ